MEVRIEAIIYSLANPQSCSGLRLGLCLLYGPEFMGRPGAVVFRVGGDWIRNLHGWNLRTFPSVRKRRKDGLLAWNTGTWVGRLADFLVVPIWSGLGNS